MELTEIIFVPPAAGVAAKTIKAYERRGLTVQTIITRSSIQQRDGLLTGLYDVAITAMDNVLSWSAFAGERFSIIGQVERTTRLMLYGRRGIAALTDLRGGRMGVDAPDSGFVIALRALAEDAGIPLESYELVAVGGVKERLDALVAGDIDVALLGPPLDAAANAAGLILLGEVEDSFPAYPGLGVVVRASIVENNVAALKAYVGGLQEAIAWLGASPGEGRAALIAAGFTSESADAVMRGNATTVIPSREGIETILHLRSRLKALPDYDTSYAGVTDLRFIERSS